MARIIFGKGLTERSGNEVQIFCNGTRLTGESAGLGERGPTVLSFAMTQREIDRELLAVRKLGQINLNTANLRKKTLEDEENDVHLRIRASGQYMTSHTEILPSGCRKTTFVHYWDPTLSFLAIELVENHMHSILTNWECMDEDQTRKIQESAQAIVGDATDVLFYIGPATLQLLNYPGRQQTYFQILVSVLFGTMVDFGTGWGKPSLRPGKPKPQFSHEFASTFESELRSVEMTCCPTPNPPSDGGKLVKYQGLKVDFKNGSSQNSHIIIDHESEVFTPDHQSRTGLNFRFVRFGRDDKK